MRDRLAQWIAWRLPKRVLLWAFVRAYADATQAEPQKHVGEFTAMGILRGLS